MTFAELLKLKSLDPKRVKVHMAIGKPNRLEPWIELSQGDFKGWQERQSKPNFNRPLILSFVYIGKDEWLFAGMYTSDSFDVQDGIYQYQYKTTLTEDYGEYIGRLVIKFEKNFRASYLVAEKHIERMEIVGIYQEKYVCDPFPGYSAVCISHDTLCTIFRTEESSWKTALSVVYGIYLITDNRNGRHYVGKADGNEGLWQRWAAYAANGHGGNCQLMRLLKEKGDSYLENFQYSILEIIIKSDNSSYINAREQYWKTVLRSQEFGYNDN